MQFYVPCIVQRLFLVVFLACQYVLHCVYSGVSVDCFNTDYHHHVNAPINGSFARSAAAMSQEQHNCWVGSLAPAFTFYTDGYYCASDWRYDTKCQYSICAKQMFYHFSATKIIKYSHYWPNLENPEKKKPAVWVIFFFQQTENAVSSAGNYFVQVTI